MRHMQSQGVAGRQLQSARPFQPPVAGQAEKGPKRHQQKKNNNIGCLFCCIFYCGLSYTTFIPKCFHFQLSTHLHYSSVLSENKT